MAIPSGAEITFQRRSSATMGSAARRWWLLLAMLIGLAALGLSTGMLTIWEVDLFKATTQDMDFTGLVCGTPLDHPDWARGEPCDGAVIRQFVVSAMIGFAGLVLVAAATGLLVWQRTHAEPSSES